MPGLTSPEQGFGLALQDNYSIEHRQEVFLIRCHAENEDNIDVVPVSWSIHDQRPSTSSI